MRINELQKKILTAIRTKLIHRDLCNLCTYSEISSAGLKRNIIERLELYVQNQSYNQLFLISNKIDEYLSPGKKIGAPALQVQQEPLKCDPNLATYKADTLSDDILSKAPINFAEELTMIDRTSMVVIQFTAYATPQTTVPTQTVTGMNDRAHIVRIPNLLLYVQVQISPFYCCAICLHPLALLVPQTMPNMPQNGRITSKMNIQFSLSDDTCKLVTRNCRKLAGNKVDYKWQVVLRYVAVDPVECIPSTGQSVAQMIPPYLTVSVNNELTPLWEVLASNCRNKEGKRHPKAVNISDKLNITNRGVNGYRQNVAMTWWQTPGIFHYYYVGVYLERKLSVREILDLFASNRHINVLPIEATLGFIKSKLNDAKTRNEEDDDLVVSSVLPITLSCPVGRGRIEIPIRTLNCQHLQCFDAQLFLSMNERRSIWKCPVCEMSATPNELFCDKYFQEILQEFKDSDDINDINVSSDGTYVPAVRNKEGDKKADDEKCSADGQETKKTSSVDTMIVLDDSDDEDSATTMNKDQLRTPHKSGGAFLSKQKGSMAHKKQDDISNASTVANKAKPVDISSTSLRNEPLLSKITNSITPKSSITTGPSAVRITAPLGPLKTCPAPSGPTKTPPTSLPPISLTQTSSTFAVPPPNYKPITLISRTAMSVIQAPKSFALPTNLTSPPPPNRTLPSSPITAPIQAPIAAPPIDSSTMAAIQSSNVHPIAAPIPSTSDAQKVHALINASLNHSSSTQPISAPSLESIIKPNPQLSESFKSIFESLPNTVSTTTTRTHDDVIKTLTTDVVRAPELPIICPKDSSVQPITCPNIIKDTPMDVSGTSITEPNKESHAASIESTVESSSNFITKSLNAVISPFSDNMKRSRQLPASSKPQSSTGGVNIPAVSIDLTEDDDDEPSVVNGANTHFNNGNANNNNIQWRNMNEPVFRNMYRNTASTNKFVSMGQDRSKVIGRTITNNSISHYKTHRVDLPRPMSSIVTKSDNPIDLTAEDDSDDNEDDDTAPRSKRRRMDVSVIEDGQVEDSDEDTSRSTSSLSSVDSIKRHSSKFMSHQLTSNFRN